MKIIQQALLVTLVFGNTFFALSQTWMQTSAPTNVWSSIACSADGIKLFACAGHGIVFSGSSSPIYASTNGGLTWKNTSSPTNYWVSIASSADGTKLISSVANGQVYTSKNAGLTWMPASLGSPNGSGCVASSADASILFAVGGSHLFISTNSGLIWKPQSSPAISYLATSADGTKLVACNVPNSGYIYTSTNMGTSWKTNDSLSFKIWWSTAVSADGNTFAVVDGNGSPFGHVITSTNAGATWITNNVPPWSWQNVALSADGSKIVAAGWYSSGLPAGPIFASTNSGLTWVSNNIPNLIWQGLACSADGDKLIALSAGTNTSSLGKGGIWISQHTDSPAISDAILSNSFQLFWIISSTNFILQQSPDLYRWSDVTNEPIVNLTNLQNRVALPLMNSNDFFRLKTP